jgi:beta-phosphoglucomutase
VEKGFPRGLHSLVNKIKQKYTREEILRSCTPVFEKEFMVHQLKRDGYKLGVCSNSIRESVELMLRGSGIYELFDCVLSNEDVAQAKPEPEMYLTACKRLGVKPQETLIVEDAPHGVEAAKRSGAVLCQVSGFNEVEYARIKRSLEGGA